MKLYTHDMAMWANHPAGPWEFDDHITLGETLDYPTYDAMHPTGSVVDLDVIHEFVGRRVER